MPDAPHSKGRRLPWARALLAALLALAVLMTLAVGFNAAIGRTIHWDIVATLSALGFVGLTLAFRYSR